MNRPFQEFCILLKQSSRKNLQGDYHEQNREKEKINLTEGSPFRVIMKFTLPVIGGNLFQLFIHWQTV